MSMEREVQITEGECRSGANGFRNTVAFTRSEGGEGSEYAVFFELELGADRAVVPGSLSCDAAG